MDRLAVDATEAGVSGFIVPDLPFEECIELRPPLDAAGLGLVQMVTPVTPPARLALLAGESRGFVYAVTQTGNYGSRGSRGRRTNRLSPSRARSRRAAGLRRIRHPQRGSGARACRARGRLHCRLCAGRGPEGRPGRRRLPARFEVMNETIPDRRWVVHKFGGSSLADAACLRRVADIVEALPEPRVALVLSACRGVTDELLGLVAAAALRDKAAAESALTRLRERHTSMAAELLEGPARNVFERQLLSDLGDLHRIVHTVALVGSAGRDLSDLAAGYGELWSSRLFAAFLVRRARRKRVRWIDSSEVIVVEWGTLGPGVRWSKSQARAAQVLQPEMDATLVLPGFIASDPRGLQTTLGRNGSDYSGVDLRRAARRARDRHLDRRRRRADRRSAAGAGCPGHRRAVVQRGDGARVLRRQGHPSADDGAGRRQEHPDLDPQHVRAGKPGTVIDGASGSALAVKGITSIDSVALVNLEGAGMIGVPGTAHRLFGALREAGISVIVISQGSSEHSICFAVPRRKPSAAEAVRQRLRDGAARWPDPERRPSPATAPSSRSSATAWRARTASRDESSRPSAGRASTCARSRRARPSATSRS